MESFSLSRYVENVRVIEPLDGRVLELLPDGRTTIIYRLVASGAVDVSVSGPRTHAKFKPPGDIVRAVVLQFKPGWSTPLLGGTANELTDTHVSMQDLWGRPGHELVEDVRAARSVADVVEGLTRALAARSRQVFESASARLARRAVRLFEGEELRVESVADQLGVTARHLRRAFVAAIGIGPKEYARTARLQRAVHMSATSSDWGRIAAATGYYDQAHLIADFRELVGLTPGAFAKRSHAIGRTGPFREGWPRPSQVA